ncbi:MAG: alanine racemase [Pseudobutyrivibrio sp.]|nr:alanine racemase [Pseudobutyrivibrio sp.]
MTREKLFEAWEKYGSPLYIYDQDILEDHIGRMRQVVGADISLCYAIKANPQLVSVIEPLVDRLEVCSPGEMHICIANRIPTEKILMSGVVKKDQDIEEAFAYGVRHFTAESLSQMEKLDAISKANKCQIQVLPRLNAGSQFGMCEADFESIISNRDKYEYCQIAGIHYFVGTQRKGKKQEKDVAKIKAFIEAIREKYDFNLEEVEYGPGLYVPYFEGEEDFSYDQLEALETTLQELSDHPVTIEMGRYFVARCGYYITSVMDIKHTTDDHYALVDGGINHVNYFGSNMGLRVPHVHHMAAHNRPESGDTIEWSICGSLCTTSDVIVRAVEFTDLQIGDALCFENVGAYSGTESLALFLSRDLPKIVLHNKGEFTLIRDELNTYKINIFNR